MAMNDMATLDAKIHDALDADDPNASYFFRLLCGTLRELWRLFDVADNDEAVARVISNMAPEARDAYAEVRALFVRPEASEHDPEPQSWAELHLKDVRDRTFHYPQVASSELQEAMCSSGPEQARVRESGPRPFDFADVVALQAAFGDIAQEEELKRFTEIITKAKEILQRLVPVVWSALGSYLRARGLDPSRLRAPKQTLTGERDDDKTAAG
jgi:hypothetical protein